MVLEYTFHMKCLSCTEGDTTEPRSLLDVIKDEDAEVQISLRSDDKQKKALMPKNTRWYLRREVCYLPEKKEHRTTV